MSTQIRVAVLGLGNCASSLLQGLERYKSVDDSSTPVPGLINNSIGGYGVSDISVVAAFDVNANKVGKDVAEAIWVQPNNARRFADVPQKGIAVSPGFLGDGITPHMQGYFPLQEAPEDVVNVLRRSRAEMCVSFLPTGSKEATHFYANACIEAGVAFINGVPEFVASEPEWVRKFERAGLPCAGDDIKSQVGATIVHETIVELIRERGLTIANTYQLNVGGNADFDNLSNEKRLTSKRLSKTRTIARRAGTENVRAGPAGYIPFLGDRKDAIIRIEGEQFGGIPYRMSIDLSIDDSPNSAGVMIDAVRLMKLSLDRKLVGYQDWSAYCFKHPLNSVSLAEARTIARNFIAG